MSRIPVRIALVGAGLAAAFALLAALAVEKFLGIVPCALCLLERWPYRIAIVLAVVGLLLPRRLARWALPACGLVVFAGALIAGVHVGVEWGFWPSPLPECAAPQITVGTIAERLAAMPAHPAKPCDEATYIIPFLPLSTAMLNLLFALVYAWAADFAFEHLRRH